MKLTDTNESPVLKNLVTKALDILRKDSIKDSDYHVLLFLMALEAEGLLSGLMNSSPNEIKFPIDDKINNESFKNIKNLVAVYDKVYASILKRISPQGFVHLINVLSQINDLKLLQNFKSLFEYTLEIILNTTKGVADYYHTPIELNRFAISLVDLPLNAKVYNPFSGTASYAILLKDKQTFFGQELNLETWAIGILRLYAHDKLAENYYQLGDSIISWNPYKSINAYSSHSKIIDKKNYDLIISNPPFGLKLPYEIKGRYGIIRNTEAFLIEKGIESLNNTGKLVSLVTAGSLYRQGSERELRKTLVNTDLLEMVVSFPSGILPFTGVKIAIIVINKKKRAIGKVKFIDASAFVKKEVKNGFEFRSNELISLINSNVESDSVTIVNNHSIIEHDYDLSVNRYFPSVRDGIRLNELISSDRPFARYNNQSVEYFPKINFADLNNNIKLDYSRLKLELAKKNDIILNKSCFLLGTFNMQLKFTYFEFEGQVHLCSPNMILLIINAEKVTVPYFGKQLTEPYIIDQFRSFSKGSAIEKVSKTDLLNIVMPVPSIAEQERQREGILSYFHESDKNLKIMTSLEDQLHEQATYLRHSIAGPTRNILTFLRKMMLIIDSNPDIKAKELAKSKLKPADRYSFKDMREIVERDLIKIGDTVKNQLDIQEQIWNSKLVPMDIDAFLSDYTHSLEQVYPKINIQYESFVPYILDEVDKTPYVTILGNQELLRTMIDNLFENARQHAFQENSENKFLVKLDYNEEYGDLNIEVANSGKGFSKEMDFKAFITKNKKSNESLGDGFGGWYIYQVIKHHKGDLEIDDNSIFKPEIADGFSTSFHIRLPLLQE